jgi:3-hydroxyacyl-CoA dehydrogenase/enoyl-CoA hydratase/3-hydroxybutyryl-CoA epimerase
MLTSAIDKDGIALVTIDMPGRSMNVIDWAFTDALRAEIGRLAADEAVSGIVIASGKTSFIAGADLAIMNGMSGPGTSPASASERIRAMTDAFRAIETCGKPVVAVASGTALGGGLELMLACHYRIAARNGKAVFGLPEVTLGILPGAGGTQRLPRVIGIEAALPLLLQGQRLSADEALALGILDELAEPEDLVAAARRAIAEGRVPPDAPWDRKGFAPPGPAVASEAASNVFLLANAKVHARGHRNYPALEAILSCVYEGLRLPIDKALRVERQYFGHLVHGEVAQAMIGTQFFARQALAREGRAKADPDGPLALACRNALDAEALRMMAQGTSPAFIRNAARIVGLTTPPRLPNGDGAAGESDRTGLRPAGLRLLRAAALAAAAALERGDVASATEADVHAIDAAGFPVWTGGPLTMIDTAGAAAFAAACRADGLEIPVGLAAMARDGGRFHPNKEAAA